MSASIPCPSTATLQQWLDGRLVNAQSTALDTHVEQCPDCASAVARLEQDGAAGRDQPPTPPPQEPSLLAGIDVHGFVERLKILPAIKTVSADGQGGETPLWVPPGALQPPGDLPAQVGPYHLEEQINQGGMGRIVRVRDADFERPLAMKLLLKRNAELEKRLVREARITGRLQHPGIPPVHAVGQLNDGRPYFVMKLIQGRSLQELLDARSAPSADLPRVIAIFGQICQTVGYAHSRGVIHRDLKPGNVMVGAFGEVQVMDWGLARVVDPGGRAPPALADATATARGPCIGTGADQTAGGAILGTPAFMAPEQARGQTDAIDTLSDVFGLGPILCLILTGRPPYTGHDVHAVLDKAHRGDLAEAHARLARCGADQELTDLATRCLAPRRDERPRDGAAVADAVARYEALVLERLRQAEVAQAQANVRAHEGQKRAVVERQKRRVTVRLSTAVLLVLLGGIVATYAALLRAWAETERAETAESEANTNADLANERKRLADDKAALAEVRRQEADTEKRQKQEQLQIALSNLMTTQLLRVGNLVHSDPALAQDLLHDCAVCPINGRNFVWRLFDTQCRRLRDSLISPIDKMTCMAFSPDDQTLAIGMMAYTERAAGAPVRWKDGSVMLFDVRTRKVAFLAPNKGALHALAFTPDGKFLATACADNNVRLWNLETRKVQAMLTCGRQQVNAVAISPDGQTLAAAWSVWDEKANKCTAAEVVLWDLPARQERRSLRGHTGTINTVAFSPDGATLATGSYDETIRLWDVATGTHRATLTGHRFGVHSVHFSPQPGLLASGGTDGTVKLWDLATHKERRALKGGKGGWVNCVTFSPNGATLATAHGLPASRGEARVWDVETGQLLLRLPASQFSGASAVAYSRDGTHLAATLTSFPWLGSEMRLWDLSAGKAARTLPEPDGSVQALAFRDAGRHIVTASKAGAIREWDAQTGSKLSTRSGHAKQLTALAASGDGQVLASAGWDRTVRVWAARAPDQPPIELRHDGRVNAVALDGAGRIVAAGGGLFDDAKYKWGAAELKVWDLDTRTVRFHLRGHAAAIRCLAMDRDGSLLASGSDDGSVCLWSLATGEPLGVLKGHIAGVTALAFSPDGKHLASGSGIKSGLEWEIGEVKTWDVATRRELRILRGHRSEVLAIAFSPDGRTLATGGGTRGPAPAKLWVAGDVRLWDLIGGQEQATLTGFAGGVQCLGFSADGHLLAAGASDGKRGGEVKLWRAAKHPNTAVLRGHQHWVDTVAFCSRRGVMASGGQDGAVKIWDTQTGQERATLHGHSGVVKSVAFDRSGALLATAGQDGSIRLWSTGDWQEVANLTDTKLQIYAIAWSPDGTRLLAGGAPKGAKPNDGAGGLWSLWDVPERRLLYTTPVSKHVGAVAYSQDGGSIAVGSNDGMVRVHDAATCQEKAALQYKSPVRCLSFSADPSSLLAVYNDGAVKRWDIRSRAATAVGNPRFYLVYSAAFSPDGKSVAIGGLSRQWSIRVLDLTNGKEIRELKGHHEHIHAVAFSDDGRQLASGSMDRTVRLWQLHGGQREP